MPNKIDMQLVWSSGFKSSCKQQFHKAQCYVDNQMILRMARYTPKLNKFLANRAPVLGTKPGTGRIYYLAPYGRYQYYGKLMVSSVSGSAYARRGEKKVLTGRDLHYNEPGACAKWFEVTKQRHKKQILRGAAAIAGGKI